MSVTMCFLISFMQAIITVYLSDLKALMDLMMHLLIYNEHQEHEEKIKHITLVCTEWFMQF